MTTATVSRSTSRKPRRFRRILIRVALALVAIAVILVFGVFPYLLALLVTKAGTRPMDRQLTETPATYGASFKDVEFTTSDGVRISGWLLPSQSKHTTVIYSHGLFRSRRELLERAVDLWRLGYGALLYDSRNHGDSGPARVTLGFNERLDAEGAARYLREEVHSGDRIVLFGISMGAAAALFAAADTPDISAVISDSSYLSLSDTIEHHVKLFLHLPAFPVANEVRFYLQRRTGVDPAEASAREAVEKIGDRPILFIAAAHDRRMPPAIAEQLYSAAASSKRDLLVVDGPGSQIHGHGYQTDPQLYIARVAAFLASSGN